jgi:hypothetical protein
VITLQIVGLLGTQSDKQIPNETAFKHYQFQEIQTPLSMFNAAEGKYIYRERKY